MDEDYGIEEAFAEIPDQDKLEAAKMVLEMTKLTRRFAKHRKSGEPNAFFAAMCDDFDALVEDTRGRIERALQKEKTVFPVYHILSRSGLACGIAVKELPDDAQGELFLAMMRVFFKLGGVDAYTLTVPTLITLLDKPEDLASVEQREAMFILAGTPLHFAVMLFGVERDGDSVKLTKKCEGKLATDMPMAFANLFGEPDQRMGNA